MNESSTQRSWPFGRWFSYLLIGILLTLVETRFVRQADDKAHAVDVQTFHEVDGSLVPTAEKIWLDGTTYTKLRSGSWLTMALGVLILDFLLTLSFRFWRRTRGGAGSDAVLHANPRANKLG